MILALPPPLFLLGSVKDGNLVLIQMLFLKINCFVESKNPKNYQYKEYFFISLSWFIKILFIIFMLSVTLKISKDDMAEVD